MSEILAPEASRYPERVDPGVGWRHRLERRLLAWPAQYQSVLVRRELVKLENAPGESQPSVETVRNTIRLNGLTTQALIPWHTWAVERGADRDTIAGALAMIRQMAVQCDPNSDSTMMVALASAAVAMSGRKVHVLTPDDTITVQLEADIQEHLLRCGLWAGVIVAGATVPSRRTAYRAPVTVVSAREALRDYLGDRMQLHSRGGEISRKLGRLVGQEPLQNARMGGLPFGVIINADRILIGQACEPMTIAGCTDPSREKTWAETALTLAEGLDEGLHYALGTKGDIQLTDAGRFQLEKKTAGLSGAWRNVQRCCADVSLALQARGLSPDHHYRVADGRVELNLGSPPPDGLLQLLEAREGVPVTGRTIARGKLTFQRFFRRYEGLAALCSDTRFIRDELWQIYGLSSFVVTPATASPVFDLASLTEADERLLVTITGLNSSLGQRCRQALTTWRWRQQRKAGERLRRGLLQLDNQVGALTAFSGRPE
ncbi:MAG: hypothetical protein V7720_01415 [Halioglobus sp.]